jgi:hypothetical protein
MICISALSFAGALLVINLVCEPGSIVEKADTISFSSTITYFPFYSLSSLTLMFTLIPTAISMSVLNLLQYLRFGIFNSSRFSNEDGSSKLGAYLVCLLASQLLLTGVICLYHV